MLPLLCQYLSVLFQHRIRVVSRNNALILSLSARLLYVFPVTIEHVDLVVTAHNKLPYTTSIPSPINVFVDDDYDWHISRFGFECFDNIQDGIDAVAEGGRVCVRPGTYNENVVFFDAIKIKYEVFHDFSKIKKYFTKDELNQWIKNYCNNNIF